MTRLLPSTANLYRRYLTARSYSLLELRDMLNRDMLEVDKYPSQHTLVIMSNTDCVFSSKVILTDIDIRLTDGMVFQFRIMDNNFPLNTISNLMFGGAVILPAQSSHSLRCKSQGYGINWWVTDIKCPIVNEKPSDEMGFKGHQTMGPAIIDPSLLKSLKPVINSPFNFPGIQPMNEPAGMLSKRFILEGLWGEENGAEDDLLNEEED